MASDDKTEKATQRRKEDLREKGDIFHSKEVVTAFVFGFSLLALVFFGDFMFERLTDIAYFCFNNAAQQEASAMGFYSVIIRVMIAFLSALMPLFVAVILAGILGNAVQGSLVWTTYPLSPKWDKLNPFSGLQGLFNFKQRLVDLIKSVVMLILIVWVTYLTVKSDLQNIGVLLDVQVPAYFLFEMNLGYKILKNVLIVYVFIAAADFLIQRHRYEERNKMTKQEVKDELRQTEGDPKVKNRIRRLQVEATRRRMMAEVPKADVVITNPTHYAVALRYDPDKMVAPQVIAKGMNLVAQRIIALAEEHKVTIYREPPLARALFKATEPGDFIPADMFKAVAEILAHVYKLTGKVRSANG